MKNWFTTEYRYNDRGWQFTPFAVFLISAALILSVVVFGGMGINSAANASCKEKERTLGIDTSYAFLNGGCKYYTNDGTPITNNNWEDVAISNGWLRKSE